MNPYGVYPEHRRRPSRGEPNHDCREMGHDDMAVLDPQLQVHGVKGLRVVDASVMPAIVNGNLNAPCMMIGEKVADLIKRTQR